MYSDVHIAQVGFSVLDVETTYDWWHDTLGFLPSGESSELVGPEAAACQGLPASESRVRWMVGTQDFFQLEFFGFTAPIPKPRRSDWRPNDIGYSMVGVHVENFDDVLVRVSAVLAGPVVGSAGERRVCAWDPEGVLLEIMEDDPRSPGAGQRERPHIPASLRFVRLVVDDLEKSLRFFVDTLGMEPAAPGAIHTAEHEQLWGLCGSGRQSLTLWSGDVALEIVSYDEPGRPRPDGYLISDQGIVNIAVASRMPQDYTDLIARISAGGYHMNDEMTVGPAAVRYVLDDQNVSVECLLIPDLDFEKWAGMHPLPTR